MKLFPRVTTAAPAAASATSSAGGPAVHSVRIQPALESAGGAISGDVALDVDDDDDDIDIVGTPVPGVTERHARYAPQSELMSRCHRTRPYQWV